MSEVLAAVLPPDALPWYPVVRRITKRYIVVRRSSGVGEMRFRRSDGSRVTDILGYTYRQLSPESLARLNNLADAHGGTWKK